VAFVAPASSEIQTACYHCNAAQVFELAILFADCEQAAQLAVVLCYGFAGRFHRHVESPAIGFAARAHSELDADFD
jgi:hypothetical protein